MDMSELVIREFVMEDYDALIDLWEKAGLPYKPRGRDSIDKIREELGRGVAIFLVAEFEGELIGSVLGTHDGRKGWINRVAVAPDFQRKGIARRLVEQVEERLDKIGIEIVACLIEEWNKRSMKVFESLGYTRHPDVFYFSKRKHSDV